MSETKKKDKFLCSVNDVWVTMFNNAKFITITTDNKARNGDGTITIGLTSNWQDYERHKQGSGYDKIIILDSVESFEKFWNALMAYGISQVDKP